MASKKLPFPDGRKARAEEKEKSTADYYRLKTQAVDDLVNANAENSPPVSQKELRKYHAQKKLTLADWLKAVLLKAWFAGIVCYFILWGLGPYLLNQWDMLLVAGVALGFVTDLVTNNVIRFIAKPAGANDRFLMFPKRAFWTLPLNLIYALVILLLVVMTYNALNILLAGPDGQTALGVEPILFGIFAMGWDMLFLGFKRMAKNMVSDAKKSVRGEQEKKRPAAKN
jgi:hypothetical protein